MLQKWRNDYADYDILQPIIHTYMTEQLKKVFTVQFLILQKFS